MNEQSISRGQRILLPSERGISTVSDVGVSKVGGIAGQEVKAAQMDGATARAIGGLLDNVPGTVTGGGAVPVVLAWR